LICKTGCPGRNPEFRLAKSFWDALIIEAALKAGCKTLLSEDIQAGREVEGMQIQNPFANPTLGSGRA
jgi:predicted nucleic acid-binding protein